MEFHTQITGVTPAPKWAAVYIEGGSKIALPLVGWATGHYRVFDNHDNQTLDSREDYTTAMVFGLVVSGGKVVPAPMLPGFETYDFDHEFESDYLEAKEDE